MTLSAAQLRQFHEDGFVIVPGFFQPEQLQPVIDWVNGLVDELAEKLFAANKIRNTHADEGFSTRLTRLEEEFPGAAVLIHIRGLLGSALSGLWGSSSLLDVIEQILGPEIAGHPVWNLRSKTPRNPLATVPWHQDTAYLRPERSTPFSPRPGFHSSTPMPSMVPSKSSAGVIAAVRSSDTGWNGPKGQRSPGTCTLPTRTCPKEKWSPARCRWAHSC